MGVSSIEYERLHSISLADNFVNSLVKINAGRLICTEGGEISQSAVVARIRVGTKDNEILFKELDDATDSDQIIKVFKSNEGKVLVLMSNDLVDPDIRSLFLYSPDGEIDVHQLIIDSAGKIDYLSRQI